MASASAKRRCLLVDSKGVSLPAVRLQQRKFHQLVVDRQNDAGAPQQTGSVGSGHTSCTMGLRCSRAAGLPSAGARTVMEIDVTSATKIVERPLSALDVIFSRRSVRAYRSQHLDIGTVRALLDGKSTTDCRSSRSAGGHHARQGNHED